MDIDPSADVEAFRRELRSWLESNLDDRFRSARSPVDAAPDRLEVLRDWNRCMADANWAAIAWPRQYGGRDAAVVGNGRR